MMRAPGLAATLAIALTTAPAFAADANYAKATGTALGTAKLYTQVDPTASLGGVTVVLGGGTDRQSIAQSGIAALLAEIIERTPVDGKPLRDAITTQGGTSSYVITGPYVRYYVESRAERLPAVLRMLGRALAHPDYSPATVAAGRTAIGARITTEEANPVGVGVRMLAESYYAGAAGLPPLGTTANLAQIATDDLRTFHDATYRGGDAILTGAGNIVPDTTAAARTLVEGLPGGTAAALDVKTVPFATNPKRIITHRDIGRPFIVVGFAAPAPGDRDFGAFLVLQSLLDGVFARASATTLPAVGRPLGTIYMGEEKSASLDVYINGLLTDPTTGLRGLDAVLRTLADKPLPARAIERYKERARGTFVTNTVSLADRTGQLAAYVAQGLDANYADVALEALGRSSSADVQRVAKTYLQRYTVAVIFPRERAAEPSAPAN